MNAPMLSSSETTVSNTRWSTSYSHPLISDGPVRIVEPGFTTIGEKNSDKRSELRDVNVEIVAPIAVPSFKPVELINTVPIQIWEGKVLSIDNEDPVFCAHLTARIGALPEHIATVERQWIHPQDIDLLRPGAIFYITLYKRTKRGSLQNSQEIRFRRLPNWSNADVKVMERMTDELLEKLGRSNARVGD